MLSDEGTHIGTRLGHLGQPAPPPAEAERRLS